MVSHQQLTERDNVTDHDVSRLMWAAWSDGMNMVSQHGCIVLCCLLVAYLTWLDEKSSVPFRGVQKYNFINESLLKISPILLMSWSALFSVCILFGDFYLVIAMCFVYFRCFCCSLCLTPPLTWFLSAMCSPALRFCPMIHIPFLVSLWI